MAAPHSAPARAQLRRVVDLARFVEALHEGVYIGIADRDGSGETLGANRHLRVMFGWAHDAPMEDVRPLDRDRFVDPQARATLVDQLRRDGSVLEYLLRLRRVDGSAMWVEVTANAEPLAGDVPPGRLRVEALVRDVSERQRLQDQARDLHQDLLQAEKLASLGQTMSGVAHELNNPLATILACAERLAGRSVEDQTKRDLDAIHNAAERAARIVRNLQTFARKRHTTRTLVDLNQVVRETIALRAFEQRASNIVILPALAAALPPVFADPHQIQQVLLNLMVNAEQAMLGTNGRGTLVLRSWHDPAAHAVVLEVSDDGPGVPEKLQTKVFDPFFTTKAVGKGTGLGLTVAYAIAHEHGGRISLAPVQEGGATFLFELPVGGQSLRASEAVAASPAKAVPKGSRALVIEDEGALGAAVADALSDEGFIVDRVLDGEKALAELGARTYDVVVCDLKMPSVDGMALFREVSKTMPELRRRIVFVTGDVAAGDTERFLAESGCRWLPKPFRLRELVRVVKEVLA